VSPSAAPNDQRLVISFRASQELGNVTARAFLSDNSSQMAFRSAVFASISLLLSVDNVNILSVEDRPVASPTNSSSNNNKNDNSTARRLWHSNVMAIAQEEEEEEGAQLLYEVSFVIEALGFTDAQTAFSTTSSQLMAAVSGGNFTGFLQYYAQLLHTSSLLHAASSHVAVSQSYAVWAQSPRPSAAPSAEPSAALTTAPMMHPSTPSPPPLLNVTSSSHTLSKDGALFANWPAFGQALLIVGVVLMTSLCCWAGWRLWSDQQGGDDFEKEVVPPTEDLSRR
jgi:hypothetical protein